MTCCLHTVTPHTPSSDSVHVNVNMFLFCYFLRLKTGHHSLPLFGRFCSTVFLWNSSRVLQTKKVISMKVNLCNSFLIIKLGEMVTCPTVSVLPLFNISNWNDQRMTHHHQLYVVAEGIVIPPLQGRIRFSPRLTKRCDNEILDKYGLCFNLYCISALQGW